MGVFLLQCLDDERGVYNDKIGAAALWLRQHAPLVISSLGHPHVHFFASYFVFLLIFELINICQIATSAKDQLLHPIDDVPASLAVV